MLSYQQNYFSPCCQLTRDLWDKVVSDPRITEITHECTDIYTRLGKGAAYDAKKKMLPMAMFCCTFYPNNGAKGKQPLNHWRCQSAVNINGLFMYDADELREKHNTTPKELFDKIPQWLFDGKECPRILYAGMTPLRESLVDYAISLEADVKLGYAKIKFPARYHFRFCDKLLMQFVYAGLSFDRLIIDPKYKSTNRTADADNVEVHIYVHDDPKDNRLQIKYHR